MNCPHGSVDRQAFVVRVIACYKRTEAAVNRSLGFSYVSDPHAALRHH
jgi:hypothetical protein